MEMSREEVRKLHPARVERLPIGTVVSIGSNTYTKLKDGWVTGDGRVVSSYTVLSMAL